MVASPNVATSDEEEEHEALEGVAGGASFGASQAARAARQGPAASHTARLGLHFSGGGGAGGRPFTWRDGSFSDWSVQVGDKKYNLHRLMLARASHFFESHMSMAARTEAQDGTATSGSDLSEVLPQSCHSAFEDALDFIYSENQAGFEAPASKALLLLKIADILGIGGLFDAMGRRIEVAFSETAPVLLEQYCRFHIPGTDDGAALRRIREGAVTLIVQKFQPFLANPDMKKAMLRLPVNVLVEILEADDLRAASEDVVFEFVAERLQLPFEELQAEPDCDVDAHGAALAVVVDKDGETPPADAGASSSSGAAEASELLWHTVRWAHLSPGTFNKAIVLGQRLLRPEASMRTLAVRLARLDLTCGEVGEMVAVQGSPLAEPLPPARQPILPQGQPPPTSTEIDFCFHYRPDQFNCGDPLRSQPKRIGDLVLRVLVFPAGTDTGVAHGSLSVFLEAVPQPHWPRDWEFTNIRYAISCTRWPGNGHELGWNREAVKRKSDLWTFRANKLDRGWHDFLAPGEIGRYTGPDGFVCIRGALDSECLGRVFLLQSQVGHTAHQSGEAAGSSASRRGHPLPRPQVGAPAPPSRD